MCALHASLELCSPVGAEWVYMLETGFVEMLLQSEHRTLDPEEAGGCRHQGRR